MKNAYPHVTSIAMAFVILLLSLSCIKVQAQCTPRNLTFTEDFSGTPFAACSPTTGGWGRTTSASGGGWLIYNTNYAGGTIPEVRAYGNQANGGVSETLRLISPPLNTTGLASIILSFKQSLYTTNSGASGTGTLTLRVESSPDSINWAPTTYTASYSATPSLSEVLDETRTITITGLTGNKTYIRFSVTGVLFKLWGWGIDDVNVTAGAAAPTVINFTPTNACAGAGGTVTITGTAFTGSTAVAFNGVAASNFTVDNATQITATIPVGATTGPITVTTPGGTATSATNFTINPLPVATATPSAQIVCTGANATIALTSSVGGTTYTWSRTNPAEINGASTMPLNGTGDPDGTLISTVTTPVVVTFTITPVANTCTGNDITAAATVQTTPQQPGAITGPATVCNGDALTYSITAVSGATSYTWGLPNGWTGTSTTESINVTANATLGDISVTANNTCGNSTAQILTIGAGSPPATPGTITGPDSVCSGGVYAYSITPVSGATSYTWTLPGGWAGSSSTENISATANAVMGNISVTANNGCGSSIAQILGLNMGAPPVMPGVITGPDSVCDGTVYLYSIAAVNGASSYTWTLPNGWTGTSTTESINATAGATAGTISVTANSSCGSSTPQTFNVNIGLPPTTPGVISGPDSICDGAAEVYSLTPVNGATSYTWALPNGWSGTSATETINAIAGANGGAISVTANNGCGSSAAQTKNVAISTSTPTPGAISGPDSVCNTSTVTYSIATVAGATSYSWVLPGGWSGNSNTESISVTAGSSGGVISVIANGDCGSSAAQTKTISIVATAPVPGPITGPDSVCNGSANTFSVSPASGASLYTWTLPNGWTGSSATETIVATSGSGAGIISVTATGACGTSIAQSKVVTIASATAAPTAINGPDSVCGNSANTFSVPVVSGTASYTWTLPNGWSGTSTTDTISVTANTGAGIISVTATGACGTSSAQTKTVTIAATVAAPGAITGPDSICNGGSGTYSVAAVTGATSYTWTLPNGWTGASTTNSINATTGAGSGTVSIVATGTCGTSGAQTKTVVVNPLPTVTLSFTQNSVCDNASSITLNSGLPVGGTYSGPGVTAGTFSPPTAGPGLHSITYSYTDANGCSVSQSANLMVTTCTGIEDVALSSIKVYPNPFGSKLIIEFGAVQQAVEVTITDVTGRVAISAKISGQSVTELNTEMLEKGIYLMQFTINGKIKTSEKLMKL